MSNYRDPYFDYRNPENPLHRGVGFDPDTRATNAAWGWIAAALFLVIVLAVAFGVGHQPGQGGTQTALNTPAPPPAVTHMNPPTFAPAPGTQAAPITPAPNMPARPNP